MKIVVIGSGFAGLAASALLAQAGHEVTLLEKNDQPGGRARIWQSDGFTFDMGPSWYWMPEVFENFYNLFGKKTSDFYDLRRLDPGYRVVFGPDDQVDVPADMRALEAVFERLEPGSTPRLREFLKQAAYKYEVSMRDYVFRPSHGIGEFMDARLIAEGFRIQMFSSMRKHIHGMFRNDKLRELLEFPVLFLGATPANTPALYSMMNHADLALGTWYPMGGMVEIVKAMTAIALEQGVKLELNAEVTKIDVANGRAERVHTSKGIFEADVVVAGADYRHVEQELLPKSARDYSADYWEKRTMSPSSLLFYVGVNKKLQNVQHHTLFFDEDFDQHAYQIYDKPAWPTRPLFYTSVTSVTDPGCAPEGQDALTVLVPLAPGLPDSEAEREKLWQLFRQRFEKHTGNTLNDNEIVVRRSYAMRDFEQDYHSWKGNAYGLANTLFQTAFFKPRLKSKSVSNLYYTGQLTVPGPGVPPALISGQIVAREVLKR